MRKWSERRLRGISAVHAVCMTVHKPRDGSYRRRLWRTGRLIGTLPLYAVTMFFER